MNVIDTSAIVALVIGEPERDANAQAIQQADVAFGKGSGYPAGLNFGDVFSYALAKVRGLPLLYKGDDFSQTDVVGVLAAADNGKPVTSGKS